MTDIETNIIPFQKKAKPKSAHLKPGRSTDPVLDHVLEPPAGQLRISSSYHPLKEHTDHERDAQQNKRYQAERRERQAHQRPSIFTGKKVRDPLSIVPLQLSRFEKKQVIEAASSEVLAKLGYDTRKILTPREERDFYAALARELLIEFLGERLRPKN
jgi:hypothetical protein